MTVKIVDRASCIWKRSIDPGDSCRERQPQLVGTTKPAAAGHLSPLATQSTPAWHTYEVI